MGSNGSPKPWRTRTSQRLSGRGPRTTRTVHVGQKVPPQEVLLPQEKFPDNTVITSKYTAWNFLPKNLFEQFRRIANFYFLCIAIVQLSIDSPVQPATSVAPLVFVVVVTAFKQAYEDWLRHRGDAVVNSVLVRVIRQGTLQRVQARSVRVGDIVMVKAEEEFPCDLVLLSSSNNEGLCHITTANLDGETNLKVHESLPDTRHLWTIEGLCALTAVIECQQPTPDLYRFIGRMTIYEGESNVVRSLGPSNLLLKGARLKNTPFIYGCAVYTGQQSKMVLNLKITSNKFSTVEKSMNTFLIVFLTFLIVEVTVATALMYSFRLDTVFGIPWYMPPPGDVKGKTVFTDFLSFVVLFNYIIPISLYVTLEMVKFIGAMFFAWDRELYDEETNEHAICNSSDLNEELGQVEYLFTDKTGTLTENDMKFRQCSIAGTLYVESGGMLCEVHNPLEQPQPAPALTKEMERFLLALAVCNTVQANSRSTANGSANGVYQPCDVEYQASSPDEKALVEACTRFGVVLNSIHDDCYVILCRGKRMEFKRLNILEFDSDRKRMSVVVCDEKGEYHLICKGADSSVLKRVKDGPIEVTVKHVDGFALQGLRTFVVASKKITEEEYERFNAELQSSRNQLHNREEQVAQVYDDIEQDLTVLGATAVEDRLQDGIAECLERLREAGIKIWVLTGDKTETAIQISVSCGHIKRGMQQLLLTSCTSSPTCLTRLQELHSRVLVEPLSNYALVVDGYTLVYAISDHRQLLCELANFCNAVVCCRMSPLQKAEVVTLIKQSPGRPITAAIGDGANDVSMIQEAHVGLGIMGKEGRQAVRCSDFAFAKFRFLQRVLLVHGHYYYIRVSTLVQYFFYKNVAFITPQVIFTMFAAFSAMPLYHSMYLMLFNITFSSLPIIIYGLSEQHIPPATLLDHPELYKQVRRNCKLSKPQFLKWVLQGLWHAIVFYFGIFAFWMQRDTLDNTGQNFGRECFGTVIYHVAVVTVNLKLALHTRYWTVFFFGGLAISILCFEGFSLAFGAWPRLETESDFYWAFARIATSPSLWLATFLLPVMALIPDALCLLVEQNLGAIARFAQRCLRVSPTSGSRMQLLGSANGPPN